MDGEKRKRKMEDNIGAKEEEKMEEFFALIKSTRELKQRMRSAAQAGKRDGEKSKTPQLAAAWNPTFRPEDFMDVPPPSVATVVPPPPPAFPSEEKINQENYPVKNDDREELDLNLSL